MGYDEKFNNAIFRHSLDLKDEAIFCSPNPINVTFHDMKKFNLVNLVIGKLATQVEASKLTDYQLTKTILQQGEIDELQQRLDKLKYDVKKMMTMMMIIIIIIIIEGEVAAGGRRPGPPDPPTTPQQEMDDIVRRLDYLRGNTPDVSPDNTREQNSRIIAQKNNEKFVNEQVKQRQREISNLPKGIVNKRKSSMNFNFIETPRQTPQDQEEDYWCDVEQNWLGSPAPASTSGPPCLFDYDRDFPPLSGQPIVPVAPESRETSFSFPEGSLSPLRNKLPNISPLSSRPSVDNFSRPITEMTDEKNNTISITPKKNSS